MKSNCWPCAMLILIISGCGQPGPLYLPKDKPPVYVAPDPKTESSPEDKLPESPDTKDTGSTQQQ